MEPGVSRIPSPIATALFRTSAMVEVWTAPSASVHEGFQGRLLIAPALSVEAVNGGGKTSHGAAQKSTTSGIEK